MAKTEGKHPGGRPTKYKPEYCIVVEALARLGWTEDRMAEKIGVALSTLALWKTNYKEFSDALKNGKEEPDDLVEKSLFERATGYTYDSEKIVVLSMGQGLGSETERVPIKEHCPPDVTAQIFWLKNRRPDRWREKAEVEHSGTVQIIDDIPKAR